MKASTIVLKAALLTSITLLAGCGDGSSDSSGSELQAMAALSVDLVDAPVDGARNVFIRVKGLILHAPGSDNLEFRYCADADPASEPGSGEGIAEESQEESHQTTMEFYTRYPDDSASGSEGIPAEETEEPVNTEVGEEPVESEESGVAEEPEAQTVDATQETGTESEAEPGETADVPAQATECVQPEIREIDLLALTGGESRRLLDDVDVPVGDYSWVRLALDESRPGYIVLDDGTEHDLTIPSAMNTGLKLVSGFSVDEGGSNQIVIDFDLRKSIHKAGSRYKMRPTLRLLKIHDRMRQQLAGEWSVEDMGQCDSPMAYVYAGADVLPDDIGGSGVQPMTTADFVAHEDGTKSTYQVDFVDYGDYTVSFVCNGAADEPESDDDLNFVQTFTVTVAR
ncbi:MAG: DUF4382 domain-containing protein [Granulosicoccus sp.]|nr:DUF4382 domain-containing protein [Granulosicoccus sp.]